jgi:hypothetical protein
MLGWARCESHKKHVGTHHIEFLFLHLVQSMSHIVHSGASGAQNVDTLCFMLRWTRCGSHKKQPETRHVELLFLHLGGSASHIVGSSASGARNINTIFHAYVGAVRILEKTSQDTSC